MVSIIYTPQPTNNCYDVYVWGGVGVTEVNEAQNGAMSK